MKAVVLNGYGEALKFKEVQIPSPQEDEVLISLKASSLNHHELWTLRENDPEMRYPVILGADGAGIISDMGKNVSHDLAGQPVIINPSHEWGNNARVQGDSFSILGYPDNGTFASFIRVNIKYVFSKPGHLSFEAAAALPLSGLTAYRALFTRADLRRKEKVLITGIGGGTALTALQFAFAHSCAVYVTSGSDKKIERAIELGAIDGVNYNHPAWEKELKNMVDGFDVIIDSAAGPGFSKLVQLALPGGRIVLFGRTAGLIKEINPKEIFRKQLSILGTTMGTDEEFHLMINFVDRHKIFPVIDRIYPIQEIESAFKEMENKNQFGKIVLKH
jgi:NADPH:quinone reductase-like Zn-dependent oxidoreductase